MVVAAGWGMINAGPGTGVQLPSGRLAVSVWGRRLSAPSKSTGGVAALLSDDAGATWRRLEGGLPGGLAVEHKHGGDGAEDRPPSSL